MYRTVLRTSVTRSLRIGQRFMSHQMRVNNQPLRYKLYTVGALSLLTVAVGMGPVISNDVDEQKVAEAKAEAEAVAAKGVVSVEILEDKPEETEVAEKSEKPSEKAEKPAEKSEPVEKSAEKVDSAEKSEPEASEKPAEQSVEGETAPVEGAEEGSEEAGHQAAAFNPETGEINWDCPCLGGMAHGPCGEEFKEAFSCFVFSETEPKGIDCIKKFEAMRTCFKQHPEHYKEELYDDETQEELVDTSAKPEAVVETKAVEAPAAHADSTSTPVS